VSQRVHVALRARQLLQRLFPHRASVIIDTTGKIRGAEREYIFELLSELVRFVAAVELLLSVPRIVTERLQREWWRR
jgi:hypothetical protein